MLSSVHAALRASLRRAFSIRRWFSLSISAFGTSIVGRRQQRVHHAVLRRAPAGACAPRARDWRGSRRASRPGRRRRRRATCANSASIAGHVRPLDLLHGDRELRGLAGHVLAVVVVGERQVERLRLAGASGRSRPSRTRAACGPRRARTRSRCRCRRRTAAPSIVPTKSTVTRSPGCARRRSIAPALSCPWPCACPAFEWKCLRCWRRISMVRSTAASSTSVVACVDLRAVERRRA